MPYSGQSKDVNHERSSLEGKRALTPRQKDVLNGVDARTPICLLEVTATKVDPTNLELGGGPIQNDWEVGSTHPGTKP